VNQSVTDFVCKLNRLRGVQEDGNVAWVTEHELFAFDRGCDSVELAYSSVAAEFFGHVFGGPEAGVRSFHQMPARKGTSDILLYCATVEMQWESFTHCA
jgi:hypothetical protein